MTRLLVTPKYIDTQACHTGDVERSTFTDMQQRFVGEVRGFRTEGHKRGHKKSSKQWCKAETESKRKRGWGQGMQRIKDAQQMGSEKKRQTDEEEQMRNKKVERQTCWHTRSKPYKISTSGRKSSFGDAIRYLNWLCLGLAIENWFQISKTGGFDKTSNYNSTYRFMCVCFIVLFNHLSTRRCKRKTQFGTCTHFLQSMRTKSSFI